MTASPSFHAPDELRSPPATWRAVPGWLLSGQRAVQLVLVFLLLLDLLLIALHVFAHYRAATNMLLYMDWDRGYAEFAQYLKLSFLCLLLLAWAVGHRAWTVALWLLPYGYFLADDMFRLHELGGDAFVLATGFTGAFGLRGEDLGELLVTAVAGFVCLVALIMGYWWSGPGARWVYRALLVLTLMLGAFGVGLDMLHIVIGDATGKFDWLVPLEDGGEMMVISVTVAVVLRMSALGAGPGLVPADRT